MSKYLAEAADRLRGASTYDVRDGPEGLKLHFIGDPEFPSGMFSVAVSAEFGSTHRLCVGSGGEQLSLPEGAAHLAEHVVLFRHLRGRIEALERLMARVNGRVDPDRTYWWAKSAGTREGETTREIAVAVEHLVSLLVERIDPAALPALLAKAQTDVGNEILYRSSKGASSLWSAVLRALYPSHPLGDDPLGTTDSLAAIDVETLRIALEALAAAACSVCVLSAKTTPTLISAVEEAAATALERDTTGAGWRAIAPTLESAPPVEQVWIERKHVSPRVAAAFALDPAAAASPDKTERARMLMAMMLARSYLNPPITCLSTAQARVLLIAHDLHDAWLQLDLRRELKNALRARLMRWRKHFEVQTEMALLKLRENRHCLVRLCHEAALHGLTLDELLGGARELSEHDVDRLLLELKHAHPSTQVYVGPALQAL